ncbi:MAG: hypothetical protein ACHQRK_06395 [Gemmatimonadales bacterium]
MKFQFAATPRAAVSLLALLFTAVAARAQVTPVTMPPVVQPVMSMGQPPRWQPYAAGLAVDDRTGSGVAGSLLLGVHHPILNPVTGLLGVSGEAYGIAGGRYAGEGTRLLATSPLFALGTGVDWNVGRKRMDFILSYQTAILRGGLLGRGTMLRLDWLPTRGRSFAAGITAPLMQPFAGRTRPRHTDAELPDAGDLRATMSGALSPTAEAALSEVATAASSLRVYGSLYSAKDERTLRASRSYADVMSAYDTGLARAFGAAAMTTAIGPAIAARARAGLLNDVLLPYDALFGQVKDEPQIAGLAARAQSSFADWLRDSSGVATNARDAVLRVEARWLGMIEQVHRDLLDQRKDSRAVWLPLQLALAPDQYDEQAEVDSLLARAVGRPFTDRNALTLLRSSDLPLEIARSIYATKDYHVLWIHDFTGLRQNTRTVDNISYEMVANAYLPALTEAVKNYDRTGKLPVYMIMLDEYFYEPLDGRLWMTMIEDPLGASMRLPGDNADREAHLRQRQGELRAAVASSARLQAEAKRSGGDAWLRGMVKVHVNITHPADFSFRSSSIIPGIPFTTDNIIRDHRKIVLYDLNEADPYRGAMLLMGVGIGEHYASDTWEDRGFRLRGPAALEARAALRRLFLENGFAASEIPPPLREVTSGPAAEQRMNLGDYAGRALQVQNEIGFGAKESSVARAMLYDLAQPGSVVIVPDPLWLSDEWAGMLAAAAARGARVHVIAPALANAPSPQAPLMARSHDVMQRLLELRADLADQLRAAGGELRVGIFAGKAHADDAAGKRREVRDGLQRAPWISQLIPFDAKTLAVLNQAEAQSATASTSATNLAQDERARPPQLHQKTQIIARPGAIAALVRQPGWDEVLARSMEVQAQQTEQFAKQIGYRTPDVDTLATRSADTMLRGFELAIPEAERKQVSFYFTLGTHNEDPRGMMLDGEATVVVSGLPAAAGLVDIYYLMARSTWIATPEELDQLLPPPSGFMRWLAGLVHSAL